MSTFFRGFALFICLVGFVAVSSAQDKKDDNKLDQTQQAQVNVLIAAVDGLASGKPAETALPLKWEQQHFIKAQGGKIYVPFTMAIDPPAFTTTTPVGMYLRIAKKGQGPATPPAAAPAKKDEKGEKAATPSPYEFEDVYFVDVAPAAAGQPQRLRRAFAVAPGDYDVYVAISEKPAAASGGAAAPAAKLGVVKQELTVPSLEGTELTTSSVIIAEKVDVLQAPITNDRQADNPYTFGPMKITPSSTNKFTKKDDLNVIFWIYGAATDPATKKPNVSVDFSFNQKTADGEKYFNKTDPQEMNAATLPPEFDLAAGHQLPGSLQVPLASFPEGDYHLQVKIADKVSGKSVTRDVSFSVAAQ
jgi:hypothetical protein